MSTRDDERSVQTTPVFYLGLIFSISGLLVGSLFAGYVTISVAAFVGLFLGILIGWHSRGLLR